MEIANIKTVLQVFQTVPPFLIGQTNRSKSLVEPMLLYWAYLDVQTKHCFLVLQNHFLYILKGKQHTIEFLIVVSVNLRITSFTLKHY